jgi:hypothetical protein
VSGGYANILYNLPCVLLLMLLLLLLLQGQCHQ